MTEVFSNLAISSLANSIGGSDTLLSVAEAANFPAAGTFRIVAQMFDKSAQKYKFGNQIFWVGGIPISPLEIMIVTAVGGNTFTVQRGQESTTAYPWPSGTRITHVVTAAVMTALEAGGGGGGGGGVTRLINSVSTNTNAAAAASTDYVYLCTGTMTLTLPTAVGNTNRYTVKNIGSGTVTVASASGTIDGAATLTNSTKYQSDDFISDTTNWNTI